MTRADVIHLSVVYRRKMGALRLAIIRYKIRHTGEQIAYWDIVRDLLSTMAAFVLCDRQLQRAHSERFKYKSKL